MSFAATLTQLIEILHAKPVNLATTLSPVSGIQTDTRNLKPGEVFVALRGEKFDGHNFVATAIAQGAIAAIVDCQYQNTDLPILQVPDTLQAYQQIASWWRKQFTIPVVGITGSVGKTTTKEIVVAVLATQG
ncbi:MAG: UDP-N-acetylmuramoyl-tripeptide--D-alanyl-D-alanine ligase, partial [Nostocaceae cyanobacterium]|nr:UDP-N-acetylmuramoyl-tripeptide--D-alanyl-D-alanine ligase [Nostocaceae cyanobacterium]